MTGNGVETIYQVLCLCLVGPMFTRADDSSRHQASFFLPLCSQPWCARREDPSREKSRLPRGGGGQTQSSYVCPPPACSPGIYTGVRAHLCVLGMKMGEDKMGQKLGAEGSLAGGGRAQEAQDVVYKTVSCTSPLREPPLPRHLRLHPTFGGPKEQSPEDIRDLCHRRYAGKTMLQKELGKQKRAQNN